MKQFEPNEKAKIVNTTSLLLDGKVVKVCGVTSEFATNVFYIVELPSPTEDGWTHITITNACLEKI